MNENIEECKECKFKKRKRLTLFEIVALILAGICVLSIILFFLFVYLGKKTEVYFFDSLATWVSGILGIISILIAAQSYSNVNDLNRHNEKINFLKDGVHNVQENTKNCLETFENSKKFRDKIPIIEGIEKIKSDVETIAISMAKLEKEVENIDRNIFTQRDVTRETMQTVNTAPAKPVRKKGKNT